MLEIKNLKCGYADKIILSDINLNVESGKIYGVIGPNGSGKTTLLRAITRLIKPITGEILLNGVNIKDIKRNELSRYISVVSQDVNISNITVKDFVLLGRLPHYRAFQFVETVKDIDVAEKWMILTDVARIGHKLMSEISGGEKQLVLITRALAQEPKLILLDEPITHLDISHKIKILDLVKRMNKEYALSVIMVLHDLNLASEYSDKIVIINDKKIYKHGKPEEVLDYKTIEEVYDTIVVVGKSPVSSKPYVFTVGEDARQTEAKK